MQFIIFHKSQENIIWNPLVVRSDASSEEIFNQTKVFNKKKVAIDKYVRITTLVKKPITFVNVYGQAVRKINVPPDSGILAKHQVGPYLFVLAKVGRTLRHARIKPDVIFDARKYFTPPRPPRVERKVVIVDSDNCRVCTYFIDRLIRRRTCHLCRNEHLGHVKIIFTTANNKLVCDTCMTGWVSKNIAVSVNGMQYINCLCEKILSMSKLCKSNLVEINGTYYTTDLRYPRDYMQQITGGIVICDMIFI